jgi:hypothetical protein
MIAPSPGESPPLMHVAETAHHPIISISPASVVMGSSVVSQEGTWLPETNSTFLH